MTGTPAWPLIGHDAAEGAFVDAYETGRLHHGWLIEGPSGVGKATLARRLAAFLLGARGPDNQLLDAPQGDPVVQKVTADAHPDLRWLSRRPDEKGKLPQDIKVEAVRELTHFFELRPAMGGWRVGVVDSYDELNRFGANALLKTLEEPPTNCALILICHGRVPVLPTIRSRCRRLRLGRLSQADLKQVLGLHEIADVDAVAALADGRPGHGLAMSDTSAMKAARAGRSLVGGLPRPDASLVDGAIQAASANEAAFEAFCDAVLSHAREAALEAPEGAETWLTMARTLSEARDLSMDRAQTVAKLVAGLQKGAVSG